MEPQTFIFFGRSGSGKGTQAGHLQKRLKELPENRPVLYLTTGRHFRAFAKEDSHTARLVKDVLDSGELAPAFLPVYLWTRSLIEHLTGEEHLIFDGVARRTLEAPVLEEALQFYGRQSPHVLHLDVPREWAIARLKERCRADDTDENIERRLDWFDSQVEGSLEHFRNSDYCRFHRIDGDGTIEEVQRRIQEAVGL